MRELFRRKRSRVEESASEGSQGKVKFCCPGFEHFSEEAGIRGFGLYSDDAPDTEASFVLQFRALDPDGRTPLNAPTRLTIVSEIRIIYCPWCGTKLKEFYGSCMNDLARPDLRIV